MHKHHRALSSKIVFLCLATILLFGETTNAQEWTPTKPVRIVTPFPPGGTSDLLSRLFADHLRERLGQSVIVENRSGAGGVIGMEVAVRSPPDGSTLALVASSNAASPYLVAQLPYNLLTDSELIGLIGRAPLVLVVRNSLEAKTLSDLLAYVKANAGRSTFASSGLGVLNHLAGETLKNQAQLGLVHIPYRGGGPAMNDVMAGHVDLLFNALPSTLPFIEGGRVRAIAVTGSKRSPSLPAVSTMTEAGMPNFEFYEWWGILAPIGLPPEVSRRYQTEIKNFLERQEVRAKYEPLGIEANYITSAEFRAFMQSEMEKLRQVIQAAGLKPAASE